MSSELQRLPTCSPVEQSFVYVCALILELGKSELAWLGRAKNNGLRERGGEEAGRIIVEEAGKYDPAGSTHCRVHKSTETHIHKTQTQKVKCDLPGSMHCSIYAALYKTLLDQMCFPWKSAATTNVRFNVWRLPLCPLCRVSLQSQPPLFSSFVPSSCQRRQWGLSWCGVMAISMWWQNELLWVIRCWPVLSIFILHPFEVNGLCNMGL